MDTMNTQNAYEQEIDLKDLMFVVLHKWKITIVIAMVFAILLGGVKGALTYRSESDPEVIEQREEDYQNALIQYERDTAAYNREIKNLTEDISNQEDYLNNSVLMNMSPYDVCEARADLFIKTDYEIMPGMVFQNIDYTNTILQAYQSVMTSTAFLEDVTRATGLKPQHLQELISVERGNTIIAGTNYSELTNLLTIKIKHTNKKKAEAILGDILDLVEKLHQQISTNIGEHTINILNKSSGSTVDLALANRQDDESLRLETLKQSLTDKEKALEDLVEPTETKSSKITAIKSAVKYCILGGVLGGFMVVFIVCVLFLMSDKLYSPKELRNRFRIKILGTLPMIGKKKPGAIDAWLNRLEGRASDSASDIEYELIAANIKNYASGVKKLLVAGSASSECLSLTTEQLKKHLLDMEIILGGNMLQNPETILKLPECDGVVLVEQCQMSTYQAVELEIEKICDLSKEVVGAVVFE
ncbi:hypothetical protein D3Z58_10735 [Clostridiaceae bacterium]|mgnify:CR=1 FL=1|nr:hypothetical protein [Clostridiaceae bacterium]